MTSEETIVMSEITLDAGGFANEELDGFLVAYSLGYPPDKTLFVKLPIRAPAPLPTAEDRGAQNGKSSLRSKRGEPDAKQSSADLGITYFQTKGLQHAEVPPALSPGLANVRWAALPDSEGGGEKVYEEAEEYDGMTKRDVALATPVTFKMQPMLKNGGAWCFDYYRLEPIHGGAHAEQRVSRRRGCVTLVPKRNDGRFLKTRRYVYHFHEHSVGVNYRASPLTLPTLRVTHSPQLFATYDDFAKMHQESDDATKALNKALKAVFDVQSRVKDEDILSHALHLTMSTRVSSHGPSILMHEYFAAKPIHIEPIWFETFAKYTLFERGLAPEPSKVDASAALDACAHWVQSETYVPDVEMDANGNVECAAANTQTHFAQDAINCKDDVVTIMFTLRALYASKCGATKHPLTHAMMEALRNKYVPCFVSATYARGEHSGNHAFVIMFPVRTFCERAGIAVSEDDLPPEDSKYEKPIMVDGTLFGINAPARGDYINEAFRKFDESLETNVDAMPLCSNLKLPEYYVKFVVAYTCPEFLPKHEPRRVYSYWFVNELDNVGVADFKRLESGKFRLVERRPANEEILKLPKPYASIAPPTRTAASDAKPNKPSSVFARSRVVTFDTHDVHKSPAAMKQDEEATLLERAKALFRFERPIGLVTIERDERSSTRYLDDDVRALAHPFSDELAKKHRKCYKFMVNKAISKKDYDALVTRLKEAGAKEVVLIDAKGGLAIAVAVM